MTLLRFLLLLSLFVTTRVDAGIREDLAAIYRGTKKTKRSKIGIVVKDMQSGAILFENNADLAMRPASNMKLVTMAVALDQLGADYQHVTRVVAAGGIRGQVLIGPLYVIGGGDPNLSRRYQDPKAPSLDVPVLVDWAQKLKRMGVREIRGDVVADARFFSGPTFHPDWEAKDRNDWFAAEVAALSLNDNCVDVEVFINRGQPTVRLIPPTNYLQLDNQLKLTNNKKKHLFSLIRPTGTTKLIVKGQLYSANGVGKGEITVPDPALYFVTAFRESLLRSGIAVTGTARHINKAEPAKGQLILEERNQLPLSLAVCGKRSVNHYAESILKTLGRVKMGEGSTESGVKVVNAWLQKLKLNTQGIVVRDGSGLSRKNQLTARLLVDLLSLVGKSALASHYRNALAIGGEDGTLRKRYRDIKSKCVVQAKTGTLRDTSAISGYLTRTTGEQFAFSILTNNQPGARTFQDKIIRRLAKQ